MKAYITGGTGFVGFWLRRHLEECGDEVVVAPAEFDVRDFDACVAQLTGTKPDAIYHLAAIADVARSWRDPFEAFSVNATGTLNLLQAARRVPNAPRILLISSAEVYGVVKPADIPITEEHPVHPVSPYAVSKVAAEQLGFQAHAGWDLPVLVARAFNHIGPGQSPHFVISAIAQRISRAKREGATEITVGNLSARRDFTDVRDVVRAYRSLVTGGEAGTPYNVCSGRDVVVGDIVERMLAVADLDARLVPDPDLMRPVDIPVLRGSHERITNVTGWKPDLDLDSTIADVLRYWAENDSAVVG